MMQDERFGSEMEREREKVDSEKNYIERKIMAAVPQKLMQQQQQLPNRNTKEMDLCKLPVSVTNISLAPFTESV